MEGGGVPRIANHQFCHMVGGAHSTQRSTSAMSSENEVIMHCKSHCYHPSCEEVTVSFYLVERRPSRDDKGLLVTTKG